MCSIQRASLPLKLSPPLPISRTIETMADGKSQAADRKIVTLYILLHTVGTFSRVAPFAARNPAQSNAHHAVCPRGSPFFLTSTLPQSQEQEPPWGRGVGAGSEGIIPVQPFREEHTAGGSKFSELLARAKGENPARSFQAAPRHSVPPEGPIDYDQDSQWEDQLIGSPNLPDPPLRNEMPGLRLSPEIDYDGLEEASPGNLGSGGGGDRIQRMMQQAQTNDQRQAAGIPPVSAQNTRPSRADARPLPPSKEEKERALKAAVERQQNMMAKARGINLDDPTLEGTELAKKRALSRAQAEAT